MLYRVHLAMIVIPTHNFSVLGTDCTGSCKSNYNTITITTARTLYYMGALNEIRFFFIISFMF